MGGLEAQGVRRHHSSVLHHGRGDGFQVLEHLRGGAGLQSLAVVHDPVVGLRVGERSKVRSQTWGLRTQLTSGTEGEGKEGNLTSTHQVSHSIFSCWAVGRPLLRDRDALGERDKASHLGLG